MNVPGNLERLRFLVKIVQRESVHLRATDERLFASPLTPASASVLGLANTLYNWLAARMTGHPVLDLTSGFRAVRADKFREFLHLLPNGFSYPTTSTMAFFRSAYPVAYVPIKAAQRVGKSHIKPLRDGLRFLLIIFEIATLYSPLKLFVPTSAIFFLLGCGNCAWTFFHGGRLTNGSTLLWSAAVIVFLIGLVSEQITALTYRRDA